MQENIFNKTTGQGHGTLIGNWQEEHSLRDATDDVMLADGKNYLPASYLRHNTKYIACSDPENNTCVLWSCQSS